MRKSLLILSFFVGNISLLAVTFYFLSSFSGKTLIVQTNRTYSNFLAVPQVLGASSETIIEAGDARPGLVNNYLKKYDSPFQGLGQYIVNIADKYQIPFGMIPAIAQCESNVGKTIPFESHNAWGYGIYGGKILKFADWYEAIERVSRGLKEDYYDRGLNTPESIMKKYTPPSDGSWARCVTKFLKELE